jgi:phosphoribosylamine--glycine ligase
MITAQGPRVLEFNVRLGDPETQAVLPLLDGDLAEIFQAVAERRLSDVKIRWKNESALSVVIASGGYPGTYETGKTIKGLPEAQNQEGVRVYCAGVDVRDGQWITAGGRVLAVTGTAPTLGLARDRAYEAVSKIAFEGMHYRRDIGARALEAAVS